MANSLVRNFRKLGDYEKAKINTTNQLNVLIANDLNIAKARKSIKMGVLPTLLPEQERTLDEVQLDITGQEKLALSNLQELGFRFSEASDILGRMSGTPDEVVMFNTTYPAIKSDVKARFNPKLLTPTFFYEYLQQYFADLMSAKGMSPNGLHRKFDGMIDSVAELRAIIPTQTQIQTITRRINRILDTTPTNADHEIILTRLEELKNALPNAEFYDKIDDIHLRDPVNSELIIQHLEELVEDLPTKDQLDEALQSNLEDADEKLVELLDGINDGMIEQLNELKTSLNIPIAIATKVEKQPVDRFKYMSGIQNGDNTIQFAVAKISGKNRLFIFDMGSNDVVKDEMDNPVEITIEYKKMLRDNSPDLPDYLKPYVAEVPRKGDSKVDYEYYDILAPKSSLTNIIDRIKKEGQYHNTFSKPLGEPLKANRLGEPKKKIGTGFSLKAEVLKNPLKAKVLPSASRSGLKSSTEPLKAEIAKGISLEETPRYIGFGKYCIHLEQLEQNDILNVKYLKTLASISKYPPTPISEIFKEFICDVLEAKKPTQADRQSIRLFNQVPPDERKLFQDITTGAGLFKQLFTIGGLPKTEIDVEGNEENRFKILKGEWIAGNNSPLILKELRKLVIKFMNSGKITKRTATSLLVELS